MSHGQTLKQLLLQKQVLLVPGVYDGLSTRLVEEAGFALSKYLGPESPKAKGIDRIVVSGAQNAEAFETFAKDHGLIDIKTASPTVENPE